MRRQAKSRIVGLLAFVLHNLELSGWNCDKDTSYSDGFVNGFSQFNQKNVEAAPLNRSRQFSSTSISLIVIMKWLTFLLNIF